jgi:hypothetical protein
MITSTRASRKPKETNGAVRLSKFQLHDMINKVHED